MPFGLKVSPSIFQRAIEKALRPLIDQGNISVYIDDIIIYTMDVDDHIQQLESVFDRLRASGFYINLPKAKLFQKEVLYLGHIISEASLKPDPAKIQAIYKASAPADKRSLLSFNAAANYLRAYIPRFSELIKPLTDLTAKHKRFVWGELEQASFEAVKSAILNACYLSMPRWNEPFIIFTDASDVALGAALAQLSRDGTDIDFVAFASKKLTETQRNWSPTERELYAIVWACEHFQHYIKGSRPLIYSDHKSLEHLTNADSPKVKRWAIRLSEFSPHVTHIGGTSNNVADWLSRSVPLDDNDDQPEHMFVPEVLHLVHSGERLFKLPTPAEMQAESKLEEASLKPGTLDWYDGVAYGRMSRRMYIPTKFRLQLLLWFHASRYGGHQGVTRTINRLRKFVWWPNMQISVVEFINGCPVCNAFKPLKATGGESGALNRPNLFDLVAIDFIGPRHFHTRTYYIMVMVDHYSRYMVAVATDSIATPVPSRIFRDHWISKFGAPRVVLADRDPVLKAAQFGRYVTEDVQATLYFANTEYPQGNGLNESSHRILETAIRSHHWAFQESVEMMVADATIIYNVTPNRMTGDTPASLTFGCDLHIPGLEEYEPSMNEEARLTRLRNYRGHATLVAQLEELEEFKSGSASRAATTEFRVGDITYKLSTQEQKKATHHSEENKYTATRSFPHRVTKVTKSDLVLKPLWTKGNERFAPKEQCKLITTFIPELMREEVARLYPLMPWKATDEEFQFTEGETQVRDDVPMDEPVEEEQSLPSRKKRPRKAFGYPVATKGPR
jgi:RNase H-like domain found in reverse transcriptase/Reverse transcriptase (RNA-dependent DNA polymerase)/Integrase zinc binding domain